MKNRKKVRKLPILPIAIGSGLGWLVARNFLGVLIGGSAGWIVGKSKMIRKRVKK